MNKKTFKKISIGFATAASISLPVLASTSFISKDEQNSFLYKNRIFSSTDEAINHFIQTGEFKIGEAKVIGDLSRSYANLETGQVFKDLMPTWDAKNIHLAYKTAGGGITSNYEDAKRTYFNRGRIDHNVFYDGFSLTPFSSEAEAVASIISHQMDMQVGQYTVPFVSNSKDDMSMIGVNNQEINPFNQKDINDWSQNIKGNIHNIIYDFIKRGANAEFQLSPKQSNTNFDDLSIDFKELFKEYIRINSDIKGFHISIKNGKFCIQKHQVLTKQFDGKTWDTGSDYKVDENLAGSNKENLLKIKIENVGSSYSASWDASKMKNISVDNFVSFWNTNGSVKVTQNDQSKMKENEIEFLSGTDIENYFDDFKNFLKTPGKLKMLMNNEIGNFSNDIIQKMLLEPGSLISQIDDQIKKIKDAFILRGQKSVSMENQDLPTNFGTMHTESFWHWYSAWDKNYYCSFDGRNLDLGFTSENSINYDDMFNGVQQLKIDNSILCTLFKLKIGETLPITLSKNDYPLFDIDLGVSTNNKIIVSKIVKSADNQKSLPNPDANEIATFSANGFDFKTIERNNLLKAKYWYFLLSSFYKEIKSANGDENKIKQIFDDYFDSSNGKFSKWKQQFITRLNENKNKEILPNEILQAYLTFINEAYIKYESEPSILKIISTNITDAKDIFAFKNNIDLNKAITQTLTQYKMLSASDFDAPIHSGIFVGKQHASTLPEWIAISNKQASVVPTQAIIAYDADGNKVSNGGYDYDSMELLAYNANLSLEPTRDEEHLYIDVDDENHNKHQLLVKNEIHSLYYVTIGENTYYFDKYSNLKQWLIDLIAREAIKW